MRVMLPQLFDQPKKDFTAHLRLEGNARILFSGKYGVGKSTFLKEFFDELKHFPTDELGYNVIHLYPVNYSVATNEDIFRYIKFDILYDLLLHHTDDFTIDDENFSFLQSAPAYLAQHAHGIMAKMVEYMTLLCENNASDDGLFKVMKIMPEIAQKVYTHLQKAKKNSGENSVVLDNFIAEIAGREGSPYEQNIVTKLLISFLAEMRERTKRKNVLIIDDLDRLDPHHIFRIFNVFGAHFDHRMPADKFSFDHIIFVCDVNNIRRIFANSYGADVDFNGYIDKFYSKRIFYYDNLATLRSFVEMIMKEVEILLPNGQLYDHKLNPNYLGNLCALLTLFLNKNFLTLRSLMKWQKAKILLENETVKLKGMRQPTEVRSFELESVVVLEVLTNLIGDKCELLEALISADEMEKENGYSSSATFTAYAINSEEYASLLGSIMQLAGTYDASAHYSHEQQHVVKWDSNIREEFEGVVYNYALSLEGKIVKSSLSLANQRLRHPPVLRLYQEGLRMLINQGVIK
jgi:hypothetical protein